MLREMDREASAVGFGRDGRLVLLEHFQHSGHSLAHCPLLQEVNNGDVHCHRPFGRLVDVGLARRQALARLLLDLLDGYQETVVHKVLPRQPGHISSQCQQEGLPLLCRQGDVHLASLQLAFVVAAPVLGPGAGAPHGHVPNAFVNCCNGDTVFFQQLVIGAALEIVKGLEGALAHAVPHGKEAALCLLVSKVQEDGAQQGWTSSQVLAKAICDLQQRLMVTCAELLHDEVAHFCHEGATLASPSSQACHGPALVDEAIRQLCLLPQEPEAVVVKKLHLPASRADLRHRGEPTLA
mmetsp:Transcript_17609/g.41807  ORF Transcript_17609/g.41807 Transcript_17609/m.41807 type:complete len:295 (-) Transcript_17609:23-907(-)